MLYVGTSRDIRRRVRSYFTASEQRTRMAEMVGIAESVTPVVCATTLEAEVRELRLIAEHKPRYNRRSRHPERALWVKLTVEAVPPAVSIVREVRDDGARYIGPFSSRLAAESAIAAVHEVVPLRQCTKRLSTRRPSTDCALAEMGRCGAPCTGAQSVEDYAAVVAEAAADARRRLARRGRRAARADGPAGRAGAVRGRRRRARPACCTSCAPPRAPSGSPRWPRSPEIVAARRAAAGGWEVVCVRTAGWPARRPRPAAPTRCPTSTRCAPPPRSSRPPPARRPPRRPRRPRRSCAGWRPPGCGSSSSTGEWTCPVRGAGAARAASSPGRRPRDAVGLRRAGSPARAHRPARSARAAFGRPWPEPRGIG